jgi:Mg-chelatase subunit ChlD
MMRVKTVLFLLLVILVASYSFSREKANIILVVDHSKSMDTNFQELKTYMEREILTLLEHGDYLFYIQFAGTAEVLYADEVTGPESVEEIREIIGRGQPDLSYTDIGCALETMFDAFLQVHGKVNEKSVLFFITDGINEPPPESDYYTKDYAKQKTFYDLAEYRETHPWKVMVLNIGDSKDARDLSTILDGEHILISSHLDSRILSGKIGDFLGHMELIIEPDMGTFWVWGKNIPFRLESTYSREREIMITGIEITGLKKMEKNSWEDIDTGLQVVQSLPMHINVSPASAAKGEFRLDLPGEIKNGKYSGKIIFFTDQTGVLLTRSFDITFSRSFPVFFIILIALGIIVVGAVVLWFLWDRGYV